MSAKLEHQMTNEATEKDRQQRMTLQRKRLGREVSRVNRTTET
jgi:hypothetical protein